MIAECDGFQCDDGRCLELEQRCDRRNDCDNGEDEEDCNEGRLLELSMSLNTISLFKFEISWYELEILKNLIFFTVRKKIEI